MTGPLADPSARLYALATSAWVVTCHRTAVVRARRGQDDRGEGVVSAAIVVLIMAAIGALMWVGFRTMWTDIESKTNDKIAEVGT
jgi:hypothetical protein